MKTLKFVKISCILFTLFFITGNCFGDVKDWTRIWGSTDGDFGYGVSVDSAGNSYITGNTAGEFGGQTNASNEDVFLTKFLYPIPFVDITNSDFTVELPATTATIGGSNNEFIAIGNTMW